MSESEMFWFHCGRCGSLFQSQAGDLEDRFCSKCGAKPSLGVMEAQQERPVSATSTANESTLPRAAKRNDNSNNIGKSNNLMIKIVCGWLLVLALIVVGARWLWQEEAPNNAADNSQLESPEINQEDIKLLEDAHPQYTATFQGFIAASTPEEQNQFVLNAASTASKMARFYSSNPLIKIDPVKTSLAKQSALNLPDSKVIETLWTDQGGQKYDAIFHQENGEWKLDWEHFARYSTEPWVLFLSGIGNGEGEFRLLARERLAEERKDADEISLVLYAPRFGNPGDTGFQSPEILVKRDSTEGKLLTAAFKQLSDKKPIFGSSLPHFDPDDMIRIRAKIRRSQTSEATRYEITQIIACHWYSIDAPGVEVTEKKE